MFSERGRGFCWRGGGGGGGCWWWWWTAADSLLLVLTYHSLPCYHPARPGSGLLLATHLPLSLHFSIVSRSFAIAQSNNRPALSRSLSFLVGFWTLDHGLDHHRHSTWNPTSMPVRLPPVSVYLNHHLEPTSKPHCALSTICERA